MYESDWLFNIALAINILLYQQKVVMKYFSSISLAVLVSMACFAGCSDADDPVSPTGSRTLTVTGTVQIKPDLVVPDSALLTGLWAVDAAGDYLYIFGKGSVDFASKTFTVHFDTPPSEALSGTESENTTPTGIGFIVLSDFNSNDPHKKIPGEGRNFYGAVSNIGVIYLSGDPLKFKNHDKLSWLSEFPSGFSFGEGVKQQVGFDTFKPTSGTGLVLTITDDPTEVIFPHWK